MASNIPLLLKKVLHSNSVGPYLLLYLCLSVGGAVLLFKLKGDTGYSYKKLGNVISGNMATLADVGWKLLEFKARSKRSGIPLLRMIYLRTPFCAVVLACVRACHFVKTT